MVWFDLYVGVSEKEGGSVKAMFGRVGRDEGGLVMCTEACDSKVKGDGTESKGELKLSEIFPGKYRQLVDMVTYS